jgi:uncharacterized protein (DUF2267 family)
MDEARRMTRATLCTLGERLSDRQARELAGQLPDDVADALTRPEGREAFGYDEFVHRVAAREGVSARTARTDSIAVMAAVAETIPATELEYVRAALSDDYRPLLGDARVPDGPVPDGARPAAVIVRP